jgi:hypothetical protein
MGELLGTVEIHHSEHCTPLRAVYKIGGRFACAPVETALCPDCGHEQSLTLPGPAIRIAPAQNELPQKG